MEIHSQRTREKVLSPSITFKIRHLPPTPRALRERLKSSYIICSARGAGGGWALDGYIISNDLLVPRDLYKGGKISYYFLNGLFV